MNYPVAPSRIGHKKSPCLIAAMSGLNGMGLDRALKKKKR
jgi:hypothetical protein